VRTRLQRAPSGQPGQHASAVAQVVQQQHGACVGATPAQVAQPHPRL
jgi:hypothetical protein